MGIHLTISASYLMDSWDTEAHWRSTASDNLSGYISTDVPFTQAKALAGLIATCFAFACHLVSEFSIRWWHLIVDEAHVGVLFWIRLNCIYCLDIYKPLLICTFYTAQLLLSIPFLCILQIICCSLDFGFYNTSLSFLNQHCHIDVARFFFSFLYNSILNSTD